VVSLATFPAGAPPSKALHQSLGFDLKGNHRIQILAQGVKSFLESIGLGNGPGKAVENEPCGAVLILQTFPNDPDNDVIRNQPPRIHEGLGFDSHGSPILDRSPQNITG
jgi:hypothetical protein